MGLVVKRRYSLKKLGIRVARLKAGKKRNLRKILRRLTRRKTRATYVFNPYYHLAGADVCRDIRCYPLKLINWNRKAGSCGRTIAIGMIDTHINRHIPALAAKHIITKSFAGKKHSSSVHGTAIASLLVGAAGSNFPGLLPRATLYGANVFKRKKKYGRLATALAIARGLDWLAKKNVSVVNMSLTGPNNKLLAMAIAGIQRHNIPIVAAAGNNGPRAPRVYPAAYRGVIAVTAVDRFRHPYREANHGGYITFAAPGVMIWTPGIRGRGVFRTGTSFAAVYCTALVAEYTSIRGRDGLGKVRRYLKNNALDLGAPGKDAIFGWGMIRQPDNLCPSH